MELKNIEVTRNEQVEVANPTKVKKGRTKDTVFFAFPDAKADDKEKETVELPASLAKRIRFVGIPEVTTILNGRIRQFCKGWSDEAEEEATKDGVLDEEKYAFSYRTFASEFSARGETIGELQERVAELVEQMTSLPYGEDPAGSAVKAAAIAEEIKKTQLAISSKKRTPKEEATPAMATATA